MAEALITIASRHQAHFERYKAGEAAKFDKFLRQMDNDIRDRLTRFELTDITRKKLEQQIAIIGELLSGTLDEYHEVWRESVREAAVYEAGFETRALGEVVQGVSFTLPSDAQIAAAVFAAPLAGIKGPDGGSLLEPFYQNFKATEIRRIEGAIRAGYAQGQTTSQVVQAIRGTKAAGYSDGILAITSRDARSMAHTALQHASQQARDEVWQANSSVIKKWRFVATLDGKTSALCRSLDGTEYPLGKGPKPPLHINCFPGDTDILSIDRISNVYKRAYKGVLVKISTLSGRSIMVTPNHPILTLSGWKSAGNVDRSDKLACISKPFLVDGDKEHCINATFSDIFGALNVSVDPSRVADRPSSAKHFHGDGIANSDVKIVGADGLSGDGIRKMVGDYRKNNSLVFRETANPSLSGFCSNFFFFGAHLSSSYGIMRSAYKLGNLFRGGFCHASELLLGLVSKLSVFCRKNFAYRVEATIKPDMPSYPLDANAAFIRGADGGNLIISESDRSFIDNSDSCVNKNPDDWLFTDSEQLPDLFRAKAVDGVEFEYVTDVAFSEADCHVYNLENDAGWYVANGIIAHNCRSSTSAVLSDKYAYLSEGRTRASRDPETGKIKYVKANQSYYDWLKEQPLAFQESVIGKDRAQLLNNGGLSAERFAELNLNKNFTPATLEEMRRMEPTAFERAGI